MSLVSILNETYRKGVHVFGSAELTERKKALARALSESGLFPYKEGEDSGFQVFATMTIESAATQKATASLAFEEGFKQLKDIPGLQNNLIQMLFQLLIAARVWHFIEESKCDFTVGIDFYPNRKVKQEGAGFHKDSYLYTTFIILAYLNPAPIWGPEWMLDLALSDNDRLRWYEKELPEGIGLAIAHIRKTWSELKVGGRDKTPEEWLSYARSRLLSPYANVSFFDPLITHSSPYVDSSTLPGKTTQIAQDFGGERTNEDFSTARPPFRKVDRVESAHRGKEERRVLWQGAKDTTFEKERAFMRVEVRADGGQRKHY